jgi:hypothetical protein
VIAGLVIAFFASWRLGLIGLVGCPLIVVSGIIQSRMLMQESDGSSTSHEANNSGANLGIF